MQQQMALGVAWSFEVQNASDGDTAKGALPLCFCKRHVSFCAVSGLPGAFLQKSSMPFTAQV